MRLADFIIVGEPRLQGIRGSKESGRGVPESQGVGGGSKSRGEHRVGEGQRVRATADTPLWSAEYRSVRGNQKVPECEPLRGIGEHGALDKTEELALAAAKC